MPIESAIRRALPIVGTLLVLAVGAWQVVRAPLPLNVALLEIALILAGGGAAVLTLRLRLVERVGPSAVVLLQGMLAVSIATAVLALAGPWLRDPIPLIVLAFVAALVTVNPAAPARVLWTLVIAAGSGLTVVWWQAGLLADGGIDMLVVVLALLVGVVILGYSNWSLTDRHSQAQTRRLRAVAEAARRLGLTRDWNGVAEAVLTGCRDAYPDATWGGVLIFDKSAGHLLALPIYLGPDGIAPVPREPLGIDPGEGVTGSVFATGKPCLLRTSQEVAAAYATSVTPDRLRQIERWGGGRNARSFVAAPLRAPDGRVIGVLVLNSHVRERVWDNDDVTVVQGIADEAAVAIERARLFEEQARHANTDPLTQVGNRRALEERIAKHNGGACSVLAIDVDHLKELNDDHGHEAGDMLLIEVARTLRAHLRAADLLARTGGDEFIALLPTTTLAEAEAIAERMRTSLYGVALPHGQARVSIGVAAGEKPVNLHALWLAADHALSSSKRGGGDRVTVATPATAADGTPVAGDAASLLEAMLSGRATVQAAFQRIARLDSDGIEGYEALARVPLFRDPIRGMEDVFDLAQRRGAMRELDWLCRRAALTASTILPATTAVFVNVSAAMLLDPLHPVDHMLLLTQSVARDPSTVVLELTEREAITDKHRLRLVVASYREHGFRFALDDVGEGNSTLEMLAVAVPEYVKLSRTITQSCAERGPRAVVEAAVAFARSAGSCVIAEGIEDAATAQRLKDMGVEAGQGFWIGRPQEVRTETDDQSRRTARHLPGGSLRRVVHLDS